MFLGQEDFVRDCCPGPFKLQELPLGAVAHFPRPALDNVEVRAAEQLAATQIATKRSTVMSRIKDVRKLEVVPFLSNARRIGLMSGKPDENVIRVAVMITVTGEGNSARDTRTGAALQ